MGEWNNAIDVDAALPEQDEVTSPRLSNDWMLLFYDHSLLAFMPKFVD